MPWLANLLYFIAGLLYLPIAVYNAVVLKKNRRGWRQRFGAVPRFRPGRPRLWIHAVSLGEINATPRLVAGLRAAELDLDIVISTTTDTGYARATQLYGEEPVFRFPLDFSLVIRRALDRIRPTMIVLVELEVWYNLIVLADRRGIPVVVVNGRLTERSAGRFARLGGLVRPMFARLAWVGAQDDAIAERFRRLGTPADRVEVTSSMKWDTAEVTDSVAGADELGRELGLDRTCALWVCGSTGPGEEAILLDAYRLLLERGLPLRLALVPRKPERFDEVYRLIRERGYPCIRRSGTLGGGAATEMSPAQLARSRASAEPQASACAMLPEVNRLRGAQGELEAGADAGAAETRDVASAGRRAAGSAAASSSAGPVILGDTMGELRRFYSLADVVFVGRSLVPMGGSDPIEVAALGKPIVVGPHMDNFREPIAALEEVDAAVRASGGTEVAVRVANLLNDRGSAVTMGHRAREVVIQRQGATDRTVRGILAILHRVPAR